MGPSTEPWGTPYVASLHGLLITVLFGLYVLQFLLGSWVSMPHISLYLKIKLNSCKYISLCVCDVLDVGESVHTPGAEPGLGRGNVFSSSSRLCVCFCSPSSLRPVYFRNHRHTKGTTHTHTLRAVEVRVLSVLMNSWSLENARGKT